MQKIIASLAIAITMTTTAAACGAVGTANFEPSQQEQDDLARSVCELADACGETSGKCSKDIFKNQDCLIEDYNAMLCLNEHGFCESEEGVTYRFTDCGHLFALSKACKGEIGG